MNQKKLRPPIVAVLGHVDHGKTTLLDAIRKTHHQEREAGGITQSIGASIVKTNSGKDITFIDTPGHSAFSNMRSQGTNASDIAVLVVAADDGVKPQTKEAIELIKKAQIPYLVVISKTDLPSADPQVVKNQLSKEGVNVEGAGGDVPCVQVSAKDRKGLQELLDTILLVSEMNEIYDKEDLPLEAVVIETSKTNAGIVVSVVVKQGKLEVQKQVSDGKNLIKIKGLFDDQGKRVDNIKPGYPGLILGFSEFPNVGSLILGSEKVVPGLKEEKNKGKTAINKDQLPFIIKASSISSLEAVLNGLRKEVYIVDSGVGDVSESDVLNAKSSNARIFTFETKVSKNIKKLADAEGVKIEVFEIIYKLFERLDEIFNSTKDEIVGTAEIVASFPFQGKKVAGCKVVSGTIDRTNPLVLKRNEIELGRVKVVSMKKQKQDISKAGVGEEFGVVFEPQLDFSTKDMIVSVKINKDKDKSL